MKSILWKVLARLGFSETRCPACGGYLTPEGYHGARCRDCRAGFDLPDGNLAAEGKAWRYR